MAAAACGTCAICLAELQPQDEAFLEDCWHHFHFNCVRRWAEAQLGQAGCGGMLACPLCRRPFASAIYDCHDTAFRRHVFLAQPARLDGAGAAGSLPLTAAHRRRRAAYSSPADASQRAALQGQRLGAGRAGRAEVEAFVVRELQALLLQQDVGLVAQHTLATLRNAAAAPPPRPAAARGGGGVPVPEAAARLAAAAAPFLFEHAERFAWEVAAFAASPCDSLAAYDRRTQLSDAAAAAAAADAAGQQQHEPSAAPGSPDSAEAGSSSDSEGRRRGGGPAEAQRSDSEGYLDLLLLQGSQRRREQREQREQSPQPAASPSQAGAGGSGRADSRGRHGSRSASPRDGGDGGGRQALRRCGIDSSRSRSSSGDRPPREHRKSKRRRRLRDAAKRGRSPGQRNDGAACLDGEDVVPQVDGADELAAFRERARAALQRHRQRQAG